MRKGDGILGRLIALVERGRDEEACAAALVLGALRPRGARVSAALARRLGTAHAAVRPYVREALARQGSDEALAVLAAGLLAGGVEREQSDDLIGAFGVRALRCFEGVLRERPEEGGERLFLVAARLRESRAVTWLVRQLGLADGERAEAIGRALDRDDVRAWPRALRHTLRARMSALLRSGPFRSAAGIRVAFGLLRTLGPPPRS